MPLHAAVGVTVKRAQLLKIEVQVSSIWAKGCMLNDCVCVIGLNTTNSPSWIEKVVVFYYYNFLALPS